VTAKVVKQRDHAGGEPFGFRLHEVEVRHDSQGRTVTSCSILETDASAARPGKRSKRSPVERLAIKALADLVDEKGTPAPEGVDLPTDILAVGLNDWRDELFKANIIVRDEKGGHRQVFKRMKDALQDAGVIGVREISEGNVIVWVAVAPSVDDQGDLL
jgi:hypothetical protein